MDEKSCELLHSLLGLEKGLNKKDYEFLAEMLGVDVDALLLKEKEEGDGGDDNNDKNDDDDDEKKDREDDVNEGKELTEEEKEKRKKEKKRREEEKKQGKKRTKLLRKILKEYIEGMKVAVDGLLLSYMYICIFLFVCV
jgi:hypothetical protein